MKKILSIGLVFAMLFSFAGCGNKIDKNRILFNSDLSKYVKAGEYEGIKIDKSSEEYEEYYNNIITSDISENEFYKKITDRAVADGDTVNIDYVGKKDGVAFEGGTASGYDLVIGSDSFIDGFEDGLIGVTPGNTVNLNLTFPTSYHNTELAGKAVVFTVKVNYITTEEGLLPEEYYSELDFETVEAYYDDVQERALMAYLLDYIVEKSEVKEYPEDDIDFVYGEYKKDFESYLASTYDIDLATYLNSYSLTEDSYKSDIVTKQVKPFMDKIMPLYAIFDAEGMTVTESKVDAKINEIIESGKDSSATAEDIEKEYGRYYIEALVVMDEVLDLAYKNAKIS